MSTLSDLTYRIDAVRRKEKSVVVFVGVCRSVLVLIGALVAYFLLDWICDLPYAARLVFATAAISAVGYCVNRFLIKEMRKEMDDDTVALRLEARNPELRGRLISTLQLARAGKRGEYVGSTELIQALETETGDMSRPMDFFKIINKDLMVKIVIAAVVVVLINAALAYKNSDYVAAMGKRLVSSDAHFPTSTRIREIKTPPFVARGDDFTIQVTLDENSVIPKDSGHVQFTPPGKNSISVDLNPAGGATYTATLSKVLEDVDAVVFLGDAKENAKRVRVIARPEVDVNKSSMQHHLPAYTKLPDPPGDKFGSVTVLTGSTTDVTLTSTKALRQASLDRSDGKSVALEKKDAEGLVWTCAKMAIDKSCTFHINLTDTDGLKNSDPAVEYPIEAKPDYPPSIHLEKPSKDMTITTASKPVLVFSARDDFNVRTVWIAYRVISAEDQKDSKKGGDVKRYEIPNFPQGKNIEHAKFIWDNLGSLSLKVGDQLIIWLEADDDCEANDWVKDRPADEGGEPREKAETRDGMVKAYPRTQDIKLSVISKEEKALEMQANIEAIYKQIDAQKNSQDELKAKMRALLDGIKQDMKK